MRMRTLGAALLATGMALGISGVSTGVSAQTPAVAPPPLPPGAVDLMTDDGVALFKGQWRFSDITLVEITSKATDEFVAKRFPQAPKRAERKAWDLSPKAGVAGFDDSAWELVAPKALSDPRTGGQFSFGWYRIVLTVPETVNTMPTAGTKAFLVLHVDDYFEVWVNGQLPRSLKGPNPNLVSGWNAVSRVPLTLKDTVKPGDKIEIAIFAGNGPLSDPPTNPVFVRQARIEFTKY